MGDLAGPACIAEECRRILLRGRLMKLLWFIPTFGDGRYLGSAQGARDTNYAYLRQVAEAVDGLGFYGALLPYGTNL